MITVCYSFTIAKLNTTTLAPFTRLRMVATGGGLDMGSMFIMTQSDAYLPSRQRLSAHLM